jgi:hypothetical protein
MDALDVAGERYNDGRTLRFLRLLSELVDSGTLT